MNTQKRIKIKPFNPEITIIELQDIAGKNSLSPLFVEELIQGFQKAIENLALKVIILSGLPDIFCSGADKETLEELTQGKLKPVDILLPKILLNIPVPVVAAMEGHAIGGGLAVGLCADIVILAEESRYGCSFMNMGFTPGMGMTRLLEQFLSAGISHEMLFTGMNYKGRNLKGKTGFNYILPKKEVMPMAIQLAGAIAEKSRESLVILKQYLSLQKRKLYEETHSIETLMHELTFKREDTLNKIKENYGR